MESQHDEEAIFGLDSDLGTTLSDDEALPAVHSQDVPGPSKTVGLPLDSDLDTAYQYFNGKSAEFGPAIRQALDEVIASGRTRRWNLDQCNNQEKAYVGVNIENVLRQKFNLPEGRQGMDFDIDGIDVDCKWSRTYGGWQIPHEAVGHICLLVHGDDLTKKMAVGLIRITESVLVSGRNRDLKRAIQRPQGLSEARWIVGMGEGRLPENFLMSISKSDREAILAPRGGNARARELFMRCEGLVIHRRVIEAIGQQVDDARRFRGEVKAQLAREGFEVLNGRALKDRARSKELGGPVINHHTQWVALRTDGSTPNRRAVLDPIRHQEAEAFRREMIAEMKSIRNRRALERKAAELTLVEALAEADVVEREVKAAVAAAETAAVSGVQRASVAPGAAGDGDSSL
ncbi:NaeI family type II restriction endonuclease [Actinoplanes palleronii]|uniref:Type II restriction enzyme NaeI domain-containing protein n=1 Tax=Actinoplanes palleronii TaxID=113570 RepID=A0ABQ4BEP0_9ACTN|nr:NaeI family type II restriction endonuclease [Actinoplanes palleronii]GIE69157.1 hypothetical protein Apa02nite_052650 [Actinoplanes palleronii]